MCVFVWNCHEVIHHSDGVAYVSLNSFCRKSCTRAAFVNFLERFHRSWLLKLHASDLSLFSVLTSPYFCPSVHRLPFRLHVSYCCLVSFATLDCCSHRAERSSSPLCLMLHRFRGCNSCLRSVLFVRRLVLLHLPFQRILQHPVSIRSLVELRFPPYRSLPSGTLSCLPASFLVCTHTHLSRAHFSAHSTLTAYFAHLHACARTRVS